MSNKLTQKEVNMYGFYTLASGLGNAVPMNYITMFMTDHLMISAAVVGTLLLVARIIDFAVSLAAGPIVQNSNLKWGKYRSWLLILRWVVFTGVCLQFVNTSALPLAARLAIVVVGYFGLHLSMNFLALAQVGVLAAMAGSSMEDRARLSARSVQAQTLSAIITSASVVPLINFFTPRVGAANAYIMVAAPFSFIFAIGAGVLAKAAEPYDTQEANRPARPGSAPTLGDMLNSVVTNSQLLVYILAQTLSMIAMMGSMGIATYYFMYVLGNFTLMAVSMTATTIFGFFAALIGPRIGHKLGKKNAIVFGLFGSALASVAITFFASSSAVVYVVISCVRSIFMYSYTCFGPNYVIDAAEYGFYKTGKDNRTVAMAMNNIPIKIGFALGGAVGTFGLALIGYQAGMTATPEFITKFMWIFGGIPAVCYFLASLVMLFGYKITDEEAAMYARENAARLAAAAEAPKA
jgi:Na+/melibiose symporter-like transporter